MAGRTTITTATAGPAFVHVLSDALTSALAIMALLCGRYLGSSWMDPAMGVIGAVVILRWSILLVRQSGDILLDAVPDAALAERIVTIAREHGDEVHDHHLWQTEPGRIAANVSVCADGKHDYRDRLEALPGIAHLTLDRSAIWTANLCCGHAGHHHH